MFPGYTDDERRTGQRAMIVEGAFSRAMEGVTSGVILAGFALALGASELQIGIIAAVPFLAHLAHLPAAGLLARHPNAKRWTLASQVASRSLFLVIAAVPFLPLPFAPIDALLPLLVIYAAVASVGGSAWQVWIRGLVPREQLGAYFGRRMSILSVVGLVTLLTAGQFLTWWRHRFPGEEVQAFAILFAVGGLLGYGSPLVLRRTACVRSEPAPAADLMRMLRRPVADPNFRRVLVFLGAWGFAANLALPFITVVLLTTLGYPFGVVTMLAAGSIVANIAGFRLWAPLTDRFGNKPVLGLSATLFVFTMVGWALLPSSGVGMRTLALVGLAHVTLGLATSGIDLASNGVLMKLAPDDAAPAYLASASVVRAIATGVAPLLGGLAAVTLAGRAFMVDLRWVSPQGDAVVTALTFAHHDFLFLSAAVLGLYAVHRLLGFQETGEAPQDEVLRAVRRDMALHVSSVAGMRQFAHLASYATEVALVLPRRLVPNGREEPPRPRP